MLGMYLKAGNKNADACVEGACDEGWNEELVITKLLYG
jgi:hypothetical protein